MGKGVKTIKKLNRISHFLHQNQYVYAVYCLLTLMSFGSVNIKIKSISKLKSISILNILGNLIERFKNDRFHLMYIRLSHTHTHKQLGNISNFRRVQCLGILTPLPKYSSRMNLKINFSKPWSLSSGPIFQQKLKTNKIKI